MGIKGGQSIDRVGKGVANHNPALLLPHVNIARIGCSVV